MDKAEQAKIKKAWEKTRKLEMWAEIQKKFRAGQISVEAIAAQHGVSKVAIYKRAKYEGWQRDLTEQVRKATRNKIALALANPESVGEGTDKLDAEQRKMPMRPVPERDIIESASEQILGVVRLQRKSIGKTLDLENRLIAQFEREMTLREKAYSDNPEDRLHVAKLLEEGLKLLSLSQCSSVYRDLTMAQSKRIELERKILSMDDEQSSKGDPIQQLLDEIDGMTRVPPSIRDAG